MRGGGGTNAEEELGQGEVAAGGMRGTRGRLVGGRRERQLLQTNGLGLTGGL